jgi:hypothetical protein
MSSPNISYLMLDAGYDPIFADGTSLVGVAAVAQAILTRLKLLFGEWWANRSIGLPVFQIMLGQLASAKGLAAMSAAIQQNIEGAPYVTGVTDVSVNFINGQLQYSATAMTVFGPVTISNAPGSSASINA